MSHVSGQPVHILHVLEPSDALLGSFSYYVILDSIQDHVVIVYCFDFTKGKVLLFTFFDNRKQVFTGCKMVKLA